MATWSLTGRGIQSLTSNTTALRVDVTALPVGGGPGTAEPPGYYDLGYLRLGDGSSWLEESHVHGGPQLLYVPAGIVEVGYALVGGAAIDVEEVIGGMPPFGGAGTLASLDDVALASVADDQVLSYDAATSSWVNVTPATGGGATGSVLLDYAATTDQTTACALNTWTTFASQSFSLAAAGAVEIAVSGQMQAQTSCNAGSRLLIDGATIKRLGGSFGSFPNCLAGAGLAYVPSLASGSHTVAVQAVVDVATNVVCRPATRNAESLAIRVWQRA